MFIIPLKAGNLKYSFKTNKMVNFIATYLKGLRIGNRHGIQSKIINRQLYVSSKKMLQITEENPEEENETKSTNYVNTQSEYGFGKRYAVKKMKELFNLEHFEAHDIALSHKELWKVNGKLMTTNYNICKEEGISDELLLKFPAILAQKDLEKKIQHLKNLWISISDCIPLAILDMKTLIYIVERIPQDFLKRLNCLQKLLEMPLFEICLLLVKKPFLRTISIDRATQNYQILLDYGITKQEILKDLWALRYSTTIIKNKLEVGKMSNIGKLKTWMIRANSSIYESYIKRKTENKEILGESSVAEYLAQRLQCTAHEIQLIICKHPALEHKSMPKLNATIDYLYSEGFQPFQIVRAPKILLHSIETTKLRLEELKKVGTKVDSLYILTKSQKQFMQYYDSLKAKTQS